MQKLLIEWKHYAKEGKTCERCSDTGNNLAQVLKDIQGEYISKGIEIELHETELTESMMAESNMILINGAPLETLIPSAKVEENNCCSCGEMTGKQTNCRTVCYQDETFEKIPPELIKLAIENSLK